MSLRDIKAPFLTPPNEDQLLTKKFFGYLLGEARNAGHLPSKAIFEEIHEYINSPEGEFMYKKFLQSPYVQFSYNELMRYGQQCISDMFED